MATTIRPELSEKNPYWIERHRYYELKHFCLQYPIWKKAYAALDGLSRRPADMEIFSRNYENGRANGDCNRCGIIQLYFKRRNRRLVL